MDYSEGLHYKEREGLFFHILDTKDGSPTCFTSESENGSAESMHSSQGAFAETDYIYGHAIDLCLSKELPNYKFMNLGIGIGYNELSIVCYCLKHDIQSTQVQIESYEYFPELSNALVNFYLEKPHPFLGPVHKKILELYASHFSLEIKAIENYICELLDAKRWNIHGAISTASIPTDCFNCILFDAYSSNTSPDLWTPEFLTAIFARSESPCFVSTYAATGDLKRALKANGFSLQKRDGFAFKRESTLAVRA